ncbi:solute carrier family 26 member 6 [Ambystoma mexicanum]|uniref:solute carrier family 26 member 6 n=1 Tax=Ambystoma mexicanum TaxID=8296 RepID=UPI0037E7D3A0
MQSCVTMTEEQNLCQRLAVNRMRRQVLSEAELDEIAPRSKQRDRSLWSRAKEGLRCSAPFAKSLLLKRIPVLRWLPRYPAKEWLVGDLISGISVGIVQLPQGLAYALLAGLPPVFGLYTSFYPVLVYFLFGTSRHISAGTFAVISVMIGSVTESLAPNENFLLSGNATGFDVEARDKARVELAVALTFLVGIIQIFLGLAQFGFVVTYLSDPLVCGYTTASAIHVFVSQMKYMFGLHLSQQTMPLSLIYTLIKIFSRLPESNVGAVVTSIVGLVVLLVVKSLNERFSSSLLIPIPIELFLLIISTGISYGVNLHGKFGIETVGEIPIGLRQPTLPDVDLFEKVVCNAFAIAVVGYAITISLGKLFATKHGYKVDSNQELLALGLSNFVGSFFQCFTICSSVSRTMVQESTGGNSQVASAMSAVIILVIILRAGELFQDLPKAILAVIVIVNLKGMFKQFREIRVLWRTNKIDLLIWLVTFTATILLNMDMGLAFSIMFELLTIIFRTQLSHYSILGQVSDLDVYRDVAKFQKTKEIPGLMIFHSSSTVYFANAELYSDALKRKSGVDVDKLIEKKRRAIKLLRKRWEKEEKRARKMHVATIEEQKIVKVNGKDNNGFLDTEMEHPRKISTLENESAVVALRLGMDPEMRRSSIQKSPKEPTLDSLGLPKPHFHSLILDFTTVNFVDTVCIKILTSIFSEFNEIEVDVYLVGCHASVIHDLEIGNFFSKSITKDRLFDSIPDVVTYLSRTHSRSMGHEISDTTL